MDKELTFVIMGKPPTIPSGDVNQAEWQEVLDRLDDVETGLALADMSDVDLTGNDTGKILIYDAVAGKFEAQTMPAAKVYGAGPGILDNSALYNFFWFRNGFEVNSPLADLIRVDVAYAGTGSAVSAARSDHSHSAKLVSLTTGAATGALSSGTRTLRNTGGPALASGTVYDVTATFEVRARNNVNSGTMNLLCRVGAEGSYPQRSRNVQTVGGVPVPQIIRFHAVITGTGAAVTEYFAVQYSSGDAVDLRDHEIMVEYAPRR